MNVLKNLSIGMVGAVVVGLGTSGAAQASSFLSTSTGQVGTVDPLTGTFTQLTSGPTFTDIALSSSGELFGNTFGELYRINPGAGSSFIGNLGATLNALGFSGSNVLYGAGGSGFYTVDTVTGGASLVANIPGFSSSGDIVFNPASNRFLATSASGTADTLFSIALDGTATQIGSIGFSSVYGLFFDNGTLFGYTADRQQLTIDLATGAGTFNKPVTGVVGAIYGSASLASTGPTTSVPEPTTMWGLFGIAACGTLSRLQRKKQQKA